MKSLSGHSALSAEFMAESVYLMLESVSVTKLLSIKVVKSNKIIFLCKLWHYLFTSLSGQNLNSPQVFASRELAMQKKLVACLVSGECLLIFESFVVFKKQNISKYDLCRARLAEFGTRPWIWPVKQRE